MTFLSINKLSNVIWLNQEPAMCLPPDTPVYSNATLRCHSNVAEFSEALALQNQAKRFVVNNSNSTKQNKVAKSAGGPLLIVGGALLSLVAPEFGIPIIALGLAGCNFDSSGIGSIDASVAPDQNTNCPNFTSAVENPDLLKKFKDQFSAPTLINTSGSDTWFDSAGNKVTEFTPDNPISIIENSGLVFALVSSKEGLTALLAYSKEKDGTFRYSSTSIVFSDLVGKTPQAIGLSKDGTKLEILFDNEVIKIVNPLTLEVDGQIPCSENNQSQDVCDGGANNISTDGGTLFCGLDAISTENN
jgi:hypothetical protein